VQLKSRGVLSGSTAAYTVKFQNDGNLSDTLVITASAQAQVLPFSIWMRPPQTGQQQLPGQVTQ